MSRFIAHVIGCTLLLALVYQLEVVAEAPPAPQADKKDAFVTVEVVSDPVYCREDPSDMDGKKLEKDTPKKLKPGKSWVKCGEGGVVRVHRHAQTEEFGGKDQEGKWQMIRVLDDSEVKIFDNRGKCPLGFQAGERGGAVVFSPAKDCRVRPASLVFRWVPEKHGVNVSLKVIAPDEVLWEKGEIDGSVGEYRDLDARDALAKWRKKNGDLKEGESRLKVVYQAGKTKEVPFDILGTKAELQLENDLRLCDSEVKDLLSFRLARAAIFTHYSLSPEAAYESLLATKLVPKSRIVWGYAVEMHKQIGVKLQVPDKKAP